MRASLMIFLIVSGCAHANPTKFDGKWEFIEIPDAPVRACLQEKDVKELREILIRCEKGGK